MPDNDVRNGNPMSGNAGLSTAHSRSDLDVLIRSLGFNVINSTASPAKDRSAGSAGQYSPGGELGPGIAGNLGTDTATTWFSVRNPWEW